jgi:hypothetical protein
MEGKMTTITFEKRFGAQPNLGKVVRQDINELNSASLIGAGGRTRAIHALFSD